MFEINDIVKDKNGILGIVLDLSPDDEKSIGVLFTDVDDDGGLFWYNHKSLQKVDPNSKEYSLFMEWYVTYNIR